MICSNVEKWKCDMIIVAMASYSVGVMIIHVWMTANKHE